MPRRGLPSDPVAATVEPLRRVQRRLDKLEQPDGGQLFRALDKITTILGNIGTYVDAYLSGGFTAGGTTNLNLINSTATYGRDVTGSGSYRVMYVNLSGAIGYVPSSRRVKREIEPVDLDPSAVLALRLVTFKYLAAIEEMGDAAPLEVGVIAEEVHELGLGWLVDYDEDGKPAGFKYDRLALGLLSVVQSMDERLRRLEQRTN